VKKHRKSVIEFKAGYDVIQTYS